MRSFFFITVLSFLFFGEAVRAENPYTCPSIESVHKLNNIWPHGIWLPLYSANDELASEEDIDKFSKNTTQFIRAEWSGDFLEMGHCYYGGDEHIRLARDMLQPDTGKHPLWRLLLPHTLVCLSMNEEDCPYSGWG